MPDVHYLSATAVVAPDAPEGRRHLAFCGEQMTYGIDAARYQVANYSDPWRVSCASCITEWARIYPNEHAEFLRRYPRPQPWTPPEGEHPEVTDMRGYQDSQVRRWLTIYVRDESVSTSELVAALNRMTYEHARTRARLALDLHYEGK